jgi:hypothetical protein
VKCTKVNRICRVLVKRGSCAKRHHCPETWKHANGSAGIAGLRLYLMWLSESSTSHSAKTQLGALDVWRCKRRPWIPIAHLAMGFLNADVS